MKSAEGCSRFFGKISSWLDGDLTASEAEPLEEHIGECPACHRYAESLKALKQCLGSGCDDCSEAAGIVDDCLRKFLSGK